jgi:hypothetical protein
MNVEIGEVSSTVRTLDTEALLSPRMLERIVAAVADALADRAAHDQRVHAERRITEGVTAERDGEEA